jgi:hypothetical protein
MNGGLLSTERGTGWRRHSVHANAKIVMTVQLYNSAMSTTTTHAARSTRRAAGTRYHIASRRKLRPTKLDLVARRPLASKLKLGTSRLRILRIVLVHLDIALDHRTHGRDPLRVLVILEMLVRHHLLCGSITHSSSSSNQRRGTTQATGTGMTRPRASQAEQPSLYLYLSIYPSIYRGRDRERSAAVPSLGERMGGQHSPESPTSKTSVMSTSQSRSW